MLLKKSKDSDKKRTVHRTDRGKKCNNNKIKTNKTKNKSKKRALKIVLSKCFREVFARLVAEVGHMNVRNLMFYLVLGKFRHS